MKEINKFNEIVSQMSSRNPDDNMNKAWGDWLVTAEVTLEMNEEKNKKK